MASWLELRRTRNTLSHQFLSQSSFSLFAFVLYSVSQMPATYVGKFMERDGEGCTSQSVVPLVTKAVARSDNNSADEPTSSNPVAD